MSYTSGKIGGYLFADREYPNIEIYSWNVSESSSPIGMRNLPSGHFAFYRPVGQHIFHPLEFRDIVKDFDNLSPEYQSTTECISFRQTNNRFSISNMKFHMPSGGILGSFGHLEFTSSGVWHYDARIPSGVGGAIPTALPTLLNLRRQDGLGYIDGADDIHVSEFIYLVLTVPSSLPLGKYGYGGSGGNIAFGLTYEMYQII